MSSCEDTSEIQIGSDWTVRRKDVKVWDQTTSTKIIGEGLAGTGHLSLTRGGATIHEDLVCTMVEGADGDYSGTIDGTALTEHLTELVGQLVYECVLLGAEGDKSDSVPLLVALPGSP